METRIPDPDELLAHATWLRPLAARLVGRDAADDVLQETWRTALTRPPESRRALPSWLAKVTRNAALQHRRSETARGAREARSARPEAVTGQAVLERAELHRLLVDEVMALDDPYRTVLLLRWFEDRPPAEVAELTGVSPATVRSQLKRGHEKLRERLDARWQGDRRAWMAALAPLAGGVASTAGAGSGLLGAFLMSLKSHHLFPLLLLLAVGGGLVWWLADAEPEPGTAPERSLVGLEDAAPTPSAEPAAPPVLFGRAPDAPPSGAGGFLARIAAVADGEPIRGAMVTLRRGDEVLAFATSDRAGMVRFDDLDAPAVYALGVEARGHPERLVRDLATAPGRRVDLGTIHLGAPGRITGIVRSVDGKPLAGADVRVFDGRGTDEPVDQRLAEVLSTLDRRPLPIASTRTGADGRFELPAVPPGTVTVTAAAPGWRVAVVQAGVPSGEDGAPLAIRLDRGRRLEGVVVDERGRPLAGARVAVAPQSADVGGVLYGRRFATTGEDGGFELTGLDVADNLAVLAVAQDRPTTFLDLAPEETGPVRIVLRRATTLTVEVRTPDGEAPVEGVRMVLVAGKDADIAGDGPQGLYAAVTDAEGRARVAVAPGVLRIGMFTHDTWGSTMYIGQMAGVSMPGVMQGPEDATIPAGDATLTFRYPEGVLLEGRVLGPDGQAIPSARVHSVRIGAPDGPPTPVDAEGRYRLRIQPGDGVRASAPGFWQARDSRKPEVADASSGLLEHDITLMPARVVEGRILRPGGAPAAGALVRLRPVESDGFGVTRQRDLRAMARADGRFTIPDVAPGRAWRVLARLPGHVDGASQGFEVTDAAVTTAPTLTLERGTTLEVIVRDGERALLGGARVSFEDEESFGDSFDPFTTLDAHETRTVGGRARLGPFAPGTLTLRVHDDGHRTWRREVEVANEPGGVQVVHVDLDAGRAIPGRVTDASGKPVVGALVSVSDPSDEHDFGRHLRTDAEGRFEIRGAPEAPLLVIAQQEGMRPARLEMPADATAASLVLKRVDPERAARRRALQKRMQAIMMGAQSADDAQKAALQVELAEIVKELESLRED